MKAVINVRAVGVRVKGHVTERGVRLNESKPLLGAYTVEMLNNSHKGQL